MPATAVWFMAVPAKVVKFVVEWQLSHGAPAVGIWLAGAPVAVTPLWH
jgi:hypothetical protein